MQDANKNINQEINLTAKDLLKRRAIIKCTPDQTLAQALAALNRTHDAAFIFDSNDKYLGVINPYISVFKSRHPGDTKIANILFKPPQLTLDSYVWDVAKLMMDLKIYFLPVFAENGDFAGVVSVNRLFDALAKRDDIVKQINLDTKSEVRTIKEDANLDYTYNLMRDARVSRLPVVDVRGRLVGIVTRFDIQAVFSEPMKNRSWAPRIGEKSSYFSQPLRNYYHKMVVTAPVSATALQIISLILDKQVGSVVIIDKNRVPVGIVSIYDLLRAVGKLRPQVEGDMNVKVADDFANKAQLEEILDKFYSKMDRFNPVRKIRFVLDTKRNAAGVPSRYSTHMMLTLRSGRQYIAKVMDYDWKKAVRKTVDKLRKQLTA